MFKAQGHLVYALHAQLLARITSRVDYVDNMTACLSV